MRHFTCLLTLLGLVGCNARHEPPPAPDATQSSQAGAIEHPDWLRSDVRLAERVQEALAAPELELDGFLRTLGSIDRREDREIGFGVRLVHFAAYGGYTTAWIQVLAESAPPAGGGRIAQLSLQQLASSEPPPAALAAIRGAWKLPVVLHERGLVYDYEDSARVEALRRQTLQALHGGAPPADAGKFAVTLEQLTSPTSGLIVGSSFGIDGAPPPGAIEMRRFVDAGRWDLVRAVLRGLNPEGRVYAAAALLAHEPLEGDDRKAIELLRTLPIQYAKCDGCIVSHVAFDAAVASLAH